MIPKILCQKEKIAYFWDLVKNIILFMNFFYVASSSSYLFLFHKECVCVFFFLFFFFCFDNFVGEVGGLVIVHKRTFTPKFGYRWPLTKVEKSLGIAGN